MKKKIVLVASLAGGIVAAFLTRVYIMAKESEVQEREEAFRRQFGELISVVVFKQDVASGSVLTSADIGAIKMPEMGLSGRAVLEADWRSVIGRRVDRSHAAKEILLWADIEGSDQNPRGLSGNIKKQMRAVSINCSGAAAVSSMVKPNDHVDVIGTFNFDGGTANGKNLVTCTILQNVLVLATGSSTAKSMRMMGGSSGYSTVTLEVTPREAEMLAYAEQIKGRLVLTLRNRNDTYYETELPKVDFEKIRDEIEELNRKRQQEKLTSGH